MSRIKHWRRISRASQALEQLKWGENFGAKVSMSHFSFPVLVFPKVIFILNRNFKDKQGFVELYTQRIKEGNIVRQKLSRLRPHRQKLHRLRPHRLRLWAEAL